MKFDAIIVDADICIKIGNSEKYRYLEKLFPIIADKVYIHTIVYNEILSPKCAKEQIDKLISDGIAEVLDESKLDDIEKLIYEATFLSLSSVMINPERPNKNRGEVASISMAKTKSIAYFATDEKELQTIIDEVLNTGMNDLSCLRIVDIIEMIRDGKLEGLKRKEAKVLWRLAGKSTESFDKNIWTIIE